MMALYEMHESVRRNAKCIATDPNSISPQTRAPSRNPPVSNPNIQEMKKRVKKAQGRFQCIAQTPAERNVYHSSHAPTIKRIQHRRYEKTHQKWGEKGALKKIQRKMRIAKVQQENSSSVGSSRNAGLNAALYGI